jgi:hypothetical protein
MHSTRRSVHRLAIVNDATVAEGLPRMHHASILTPCAVEVVYTCSGMKVLVASVVCELRDCPLCDALSDFRVDYDDGLTAGGCTARTLCTPWLRCRSRWDLARREMPKVGARPPCWPSCLLSRSLTTLSSACIPSCRPSCSPSLFSLHDASLPLFSLASGPGWPAIDKMGAWDAAASRRVPDQSASLPPRAHRRRHVGTARHASDARLIPAAT